MRRSLLLLALACACAPRPALSQAVPPQVTEGDRVRVSAPGLRGVFVVAAASGDTLLLRRSESNGEVLVVPLSSMTRMDVRRPRASGAGAWHHAGIGLLAGGTSGAIIGMAGGDDPPGIVSFTAGEKALIGGLFLGGVGAVIGGIIGYSYPGESWRRVDVGGVAASLTVNGTVRVGYHYTF